MMMLLFYPSESFDITLHKPPLIIHKLNYDLTKLHLITSHKLHLVESPTRIMITRHSFEIGFQPVSFAECDDAPARVMENKLINEIFVY